MIFDVSSLVFFLCYIAVTTVYGAYMYRVGIVQGINNTLLTLSESRSELVRDALKALEQRANRSQK
jgi:hypothetical protein